MDLTTTLQAFGRVRISSRRRAIPWSEIALLIQSRQSWYSGLSSRTWSTVWWPTSQSHRGEWRRFTRFRSAPSVVLPGSGCIWMTSLRYAALTVIVTPSLSVLRSSVSLASCTRALSYSIFATRRLGRVDAAVRRIYWLWEFRGSWSSWFPPLRNPSVGMLLACRLSEKIEAKRAEMNYYQEKRNKTNVLCRQSLIRKSYRAPAINRPCSWITKIIKLRKRQSTSQPSSDLLWRLGAMQRISDWGTAAAKVHTVVNWTHRCGLIHTRIVVPSE
jgi:hypothetical protein